MKEYLIPLIALLVGFAIAFPAGIVYLQKSGRSRARFC